MDVGYHRLARAHHRYRWWRLPLGLLVGGALYLVLSLVAVAVVALADSEVLAALMVSPSDLDPMASPGTFAFFMVSVILLLPVVYLTLLIVRARPVGLISSVTGRLRWGWLGWCTAVALVVFTVSLGASFALGAALGGDAASAPRWSAHTAVLIALVLLLVPFQAAAEEYVFRGYLFQLFGQWFARPWLPALLTVPFFTFGHVYGGPGLVDVAIFGVLAIWLTWRTGGLEAAIAAHVVNNVLLLLLAALGVIGYDPSAEGDWWGVGSTIVTMGVFAFLVDRRAERRALANARRVRTAPVVV